MTQAQTMNMKDLQTVIDNVVKSSVKAAMDETGKDLSAFKDTISKEVATQISAIKDQTVDKTLDARRMKVIPHDDVKIEVGDNRIIYDVKGGFKCLSHFASHVAIAEKSKHVKISKELGEWEKTSEHYQWEKNGDGTWTVYKAADATTMRVDDSEYGGFLVPPEFRNELWLAVEQKNEILPRCTQIPMAVNSVKIPYVNGFDESGGLVYGGIEWKWVDELGGFTATRPKMGRISLELKKLAGLAYSSDEILADSPISMENVLKNGFQSGLNFQLNKVLVRGTGAGQPLGILNAPCLVSVTKETGQAAGTIVYENILKMFSRIFDSTNAVWLANESTLPQLATMSLAVGTGGLPVFLPANGAAGTPYATLFGRPLIFNKHCSTVGTQGDLILADWSQYLLGQKAGQGATGKFDTSIHLKFDVDQVAFRFIFRIDGQPWWPTYFTPPQATTNTMSPFIVLDTRA